MNEGEESQAGFHVCATLSPHAVGNVVQRGAFDLVSPFLEVLCMRKGLIALQQLLFEGVKLLFFFGLLLGPGA